MKNVPALALLALCIAGPALAAEAEPKVDIANEGGIRDKWMLADGAKLAAPAYPEGFANAQRDVCLALGYQINPDGTTSGYRVLKQWNSETAGDEPVDGFWNSFANAGADALRQWKFQKRPEVASAAPVFTVATLTWQTRKDTNPATLRAQCKIGDLVTYMRDVDHNLRGINGYDIERTARRREDRVQVFAGTPKNQPGIKP
ncbi:MAG: hypothetical protein HOQ01_02375 [Lysobacter sp.]|nr:hypothetical protein [Lysobacter sp.]